MKQPFAVIEIKRRDVETGKFDSVGHVDVESGDHLVLHVGHPLHAEGLSSVVSQLGHALGGQGTIEVHADEKPASLEESREEQRDRIEADNEARARAAETRRAEAGEGPSAT